MPILIDRIDAQLTGLRAERARIVQQAKDNMADVDMKIAALVQARQTITPDVETAYATLRALGFTKDL